MSKRKSDVRDPVSYAYLAFGFLALYIYHQIAGGAWSSILTMSALIQCFGVVLLCMQVLTSGTADGISAGALMLDAWAFALRLTNTTWMDGYLPVDASGDYAYQIVDVCSLLMILWLLHHVLVVKRHTYEASVDTFPVSWVVFASVGLAAVLRPNVNDLPLFDTFWMASVFIGAVSVLPQLAVTMKTGGLAKALTSHYIMALALSRVLSGIYMWEARLDLSCDEFIQGFNHAAWAVLVAHLIHMLLLSDFAYYYIIHAYACVREGRSAPLEIKNVAFDI
jgi:hypothetical protein